jgi:hypothetical protein
MKRAALTEEQIIGVLREREASAGRKSALLLRFELESTRCDPKARRLRSRRIWGRHRSCLALGPAQHGVENPSGRSTVAELGR